MPTTRATRATRLFGVALTGSALLALAACGSPTDEPAASASGDATASAATCTPETMKTLTAGTLTIGAWYNDELVRREGSWLIAARTGNAVWWSGNPAVLGLEGVPNAFPRHEGHLSPAWLGS